MSEVVISNPQLIKLSTVLDITSGMCLSEEICNIYLFYPFEVPPDVYRRVPLARGTIACWKYAAILFIIKVSS